MSKPVKWIAIVLAAVVVLIAVAVVGVYALSARELGRTYEVADESIAVPTDPADIAEGERLSTLMGCNDCHAADLGGKMLLDAPIFAVLSTPNLTLGQGGVGQAYTVADWEHAIRHGVRRDGSPLIIMPSADYNHLSDEDIGRVIAYLRQLPPVDRDQHARSFGPIGRMAALGSRAAFFSASAIDHHAMHPITVARGVNPEFGEYYARACVGCHGPDWSGGPMPGGAPGDPPAANLTPDSATGIGSWTEAQFARALREGVRPDGSPLADAMPWRAFSHFADDEVSAMWLFFRTLPPVSKP